MDYFTTGYKLIRTQHAAVWLAVRSMTWPPLVRPHRVPGLKLRQGWEAFHSLKLHGCYSSAMVVYTWLSSLVAKFGDYLYKSFY